MTQNTNNLLQLSHLTVFQLGRVELDFVVIFFDNVQRPMAANLWVDAAIVDKFPFFTVRVHDVVGIIASMMGIAGLKVFSQRLCSTLPGQTRHLNLTAKILIFEIKGHTVHPAVLHPWRQCAARWLR